MALARYEYYNEGDTSAGQYYGVNWTGQTFKPDSTFTILYVKLKLARVGSPGTITVSIRATSAGLPTGADLISGTTDGDTLTTNAAGEWRTITLFPGTTLTADTTYAIVVRALDGDISTNYMWWRADNTSPTYTNGSVVSSSNAGDTWGSTTGTDFMFETWGSSVAAALDDKTYSRRLVAIGGYTVYYESSAGTMTELTDATLDVDTSSPLTATQAYGKLFIANGTSSRIFDYINTKIATADAGANPCTPGMKLTGQTSTAEMYVDYVDGVTDDAAANIYGTRITTATFSSGETVTGTNADGNAVSFTTSAAETAPPHWYNWTVFGQDTTKYGTMLSAPTLVCLYRGRVVTAGDSTLPYAWQMSKVGDPFKVLYDFTNDGDLSAVTYTNTQVGRVGDVIVSLIPYKDDLLIFGCANSVWLLIGDPLASGQLAEVVNTTGMWGSRAWCIDDANNLYFLGNDGIYVMPVGETSSPVRNISKVRLPNLITDLDLDKDTHRIVMSYDPVEHGIILSKTTISDGSNENYFYSLITEGFFPETYDDSCGVFCSYYYPATDETYKKFLVGCYDGYIREFDPATKNDATTSSTAAINSYCTIIQQIGETEFYNAMLREFSGILSGGASSGDFTDSDAVSFELHTGKDAETVLEDVKDGATAFTSGTWSTVGKQNKYRPRMRGCYAGIKLYNSTASQTWSLEKLYGEVIPKGKI